MTCNSVTAWAVLRLAWFNTRVRWAEWRARRADVYLDPDVVSRVKVMAGKGHLGQIRIEVLAGACAVGGLMWFGLWICVR